MRVQVPRWCKESWPRIRVQTDVMGWRLMGYGKGRLWNIEPPKLIWQQVEKRMRLFHQEVPRAEIVTLTSASKTGNADCR